MSLTITIPGAVNVTTGSTAPAVLTIGVGVPGAQGPQGPAGQGVPVGGTAGQFLTKIDGTNYNTDWTTVNLSVYAVKANNLSDLSSASTARTNLGLGTMATASAADYSTTTVANGLYYPLSGNPSSFLTASALTGYATQSFVAANYAPIAAGLPTGGTVGQVLTKNSGTDYDDSWQTLIPGDRYLTTSTTSNTISNGTKTFTVGTGLSYSSQQDVVISYDAANHMHALVTSYNSGTGVLVVDVQNHTGAGTYTSWTVNVGGMVPLQTVEWGEILGTLGDQTDLANALNAKLETSTAASTYAALAGATFTGEVVTPASTTSSAGLMITPGVAPSAPVNGELWATTTDLQVRLNGVTETLAEQSWVTAGFYPLSGNPSGFITSSALTPYAPLAGATFTGLVNTVASATGGAGFRLPHGAAPTTPTDGDLFTTTSGLFARINGTTRQYVDFDGTQTINGAKTFSNANQTLGNSTAAGTINIGSGATISGATKTINVGSGGVSGSTTNINLGTTSGGGATITLQNNTVVGGTLTVNGANLTLGTSTAAGTIGIGTGATVSGSTRTINIGTASAAGSTNAIVIGGGSGTSTTTLQGTTNGVTVAADTNSTALATTAFVVGQASATAPSNDAATASAGTSLRYARADHVHLNPLPTGGTAGQVLSKIDGTNYNTQWVTPSGGGSATDYQAYETAGTFTWTKPANAKWVEVLMFGGGGGGGSGARQATAANRGGGGGGSGSAVLLARMAASALGATQTVVVGAGGTGGASASADSTNGSNGTAGGNSTFSIFTARGGVNGSAGTSTGGGASGTAINAWIYAFTQGSGTGGSGNVGTGSTAGVLTYQSSINASGGGGGGGQTGTVTTPSGGGAGGAKTAPTTAQSGMTAVSGGAGGTTAGVAPTAGVTGAVTTGGTGGGGGAYITAVAGQAGASGAFPGGGGGGGSASDNGFASGAGGAGGGGAVYIITYC